MDVIGEKQLSDFGSRSGQICPLMHVALMSLIRICGACLFLFQYNTFHIACKPVFYASDLLRYREQVTTKVYIKQIRYIFTNKGITMALISDYHEAKSGLPLCYSQAGLCLYHLRSVKSSFLATKGPDIM